jgi:hypothetical protein
MNMHQLGRGTVAAGMLATLAACSAVSSIGNVLGGIIPGGGSQSQVSGYVSGVDTRAQVIGLQQPNGQPVNLLFDNQTKVVYNNQSYPVTSLDRGDQVTARIQNTNNGYYTDLVQVDQPVNRSAGTSSSASGTAQSVQGTVRQIDRQNGLFTMDVSNGTRLTVSMPYSPNRADLTKFENLRSGDVVRFAGVYVNNSRVELRQFY